VFTDIALTNEVATNLDANKNLLQNFTFTYKASYGDLYLVVTSGNAPNLVYTLDMEFEKLQSSRNREMVEDTRRLISQRKIKATTTIDWIWMDQIISTAKQYSVLTASTMTFNMSYCPSSSPTNSLTFQVTSTDEASAFALYVCIQASEFPCTPQSAQRQNSDARGIALVTVALETSSAQFTKLQATVVGWGQYTHQNNFLFSVNTRTII
jgi:hypothetical protein